MITAEDEETTAILKQDFEVLWEHAAGGQKRTRLLDKAIAYYTELIATSIGVICR